MIATSRSSGDTHTQTHTSESSVIQQLCSWNTPGSAGAGRRGNRLLVLLVAQIKVGQLSSCFITATFCSV